MLPSVGGWLSLQCMTITLLSPVRRAPRAGELAALMLAWLLLLLLAGAGAGQGALLHLPEGAVRGKLEVSQDGRPFHSFYGIRYAEPPTGRLRLMRPVRVSGWAGEAGGAGRSGVECSQEDSGRESVLGWGGAALRGGEDCLVLNIYTPDLQPAEPLPVMLFVHGGGYFAGSGGAGIYGPEFLMDHGVILVTVNYRLGPLGWLSLGDSVMPGNLGLWDILLASQFTKARIIHFGGDPDKGAYIHISVLSVYPCLPVYPYHGDGCV